MRKIGLALLLATLFGCVYPAVMNYNTSWDKLPEKVEVAFSNKYNKEDVSHIEMSVFRNKTVAFHFFFKDDVIIEILPDGYEMGVIKATPQNMDKTEP